VIDGCKLCAEQRCAVTKVLPLLQRGGMLSHVLEEPNFTQEFHAAGVKHVRAWVRAALVCRVEV
jgi:hypothetical protein